jgi:hypothetical protein
MQIQNSLKFIQKKLIEFKPSWCQREANIINKIKEFFYFFKYFLLIYFVDKFTKLRKAETFLKYYGNCFC